MIKELENKNKILVQTYAQVEHLNRVIIGMAIRDFLFKERGYTLTIVDTYYKRFLEIGLEVVINWETAPYRHKLTGERSVQGYIRELKYGVRKEEPGTLSET